MGSHRARRRIVGLARLLVAVGSVSCAVPNDEAPPVPRSTLAVANVTPTASETAPPRDLVEPTRPRPREPRETTFLGRRDQELLEAIGTRQPVGARGTSGSSLSMYLNLEGDIDAAFKPHTFAGQRWNGEVAAYRIGRLLGFDRVPPATTRRFKVPVLEALLRDEPEVLARFKAEAVLAADNTVQGAVMYWVPVIHRAEVDRLDQLEQWTRWLRQGASIPPERLSFVQQLSDTVVFDYVTGNWDRWSIHNVFYDSERTTLLLMDNNGAFGTRFAPHVRLRLETPLEQVERFRATTYRRLLGLREEDIRSELAQDPAGPALLTDGQIESVLARRDTIVRRIESLAGVHGHDAVLCFP